MLLNGDYDLAVAMVDGTFVRAHQHSAGAPKATARRRNPALFRVSDDPAAGRPPI